MYIIFKSLFIKDKIKNIPLILILCVFALAIIGFFMMFTAAGGNIYPWANKQILNFVFFCFVTLMISIINIKTWYNISYLLYFIVLILLILVEVKGHTAMGATRWIGIGSLRIQPSELIKLFLVLSLAKYFHDIPLNRINKLKNLIIPVLMTLFPFFLILRQPDLGTGMILILLSGAIFYIVGVSSKKFIILFSIFAILSPLSWQLMHQYQKQRVRIFLNPEIDPLGSGYNIIQSKIAIGSGGLFGKGFLRGSQSQLDFLPEHQTDFVFTMICEECGFIGAIAIIFLYSIVICYGIIISINSKNHYGRIVAFGISMIIFLHAFINMAMVMGLVPVVGVPLPLISYGRTVMMTILISIGLLINIKIHNNNLNF